MNYFMTEYSETNLYIVLTNTVVYVNNFSSFSAVSIVVLLYVGIYLHIWNGIYDVHQGSPASRELQQNKRWRAHGVRIHYGLKDSIQEYRCLLISEFIVLPFKAVNASTFVTWLIHMSCFAKTLKVICQVYVEMWKVLEKQLNRWESYWWLSSCRLGTSDVHLCISTKTTGSSLSPS